MAEPIPLPLPPPTEPLRQPLEKCANEHAAALLAACEILQGLQDRGVLEMAKGAVNSSDKVLQILVDTANQPEMIRGLRNLIILTKTLSSLDPELLEQVQRGVQSGLAEAQKPNPPGWWPLIKRLLSRDSRRVLIATAGVLEATGKYLGGRKSSGKV